MYILLLLLCYGHGILNMCNDLSACCAHKGETGNDESEQESTQKHRKMALHPAAFFCMLN